MSSRRHGIPESASISKGARTMFTKEHMNVDLAGLSVQDGLTMLQVIRRLVKSGVMEDLELAPVTEIRTKLVKNIQTATGVNYDVAFAQAMQMGPAAMAAGAQAAGAAATNGAAAAKR
jgi:hypothetical protein